MITDTWCENRALIVGMSAAERRVVNGIIMHERGEVDQLDDGGEGGSARRRPPVA